MLSGERPQECSNCYAKEACGNESYRTLSNIEFKKTLENIQEGKKPTIEYLDLRPGNICNLKCRMCGPESSVLTIPEASILANDDNRFLNYQSVNWHKSTTFIENILRHAKTLKKLHFAGGEPFIIPQVKNIINDLSQDPIAKEITLSFNTNLTVLPTSLAKNFSDFKEVNIFVSLDGTQEVNDYIRYPSRFKDIELNLMQLEKKFKEWRIGEVRVHTAISIYNIFNLPSLYKYLSRYKRVSNVPDIDLVNYPEELSIKVLPKKLKDKVNKYYEKELLPNLKDKGQIHYMLNEMASEDCSHLLPSFVTRTKLMDEKRCQNFKKTIPELAGLMQ